MKFWNSEIWHFEILKNYILNFGWKYDVRAAPPPASRPGRATTTRNYSQPPGPCPIAPRDEITPCGETPHSDLTSCVRCAPARWGPFQHNSLVWKPGVRCAALWRRTSSVKNSVAPGAPSLPENTCRSACTGIFLHDVRHENRAGQHGRWKSKCSSMKNENATRPGGGKSRASAERRSANRATQHGHWKSKCSSMICATE